MKSRSSNNGHQSRNLLRDIKAARRDLQRSMDRALALADQEVGLATKPKPYTPQPKQKKQGSNGNAAGSGGYRSNLASGMHWAPIRPVDEPEAGSRAFQIKGNTTTFGVAGTPITSGFLTDLGEYNPELMGRNAIPVYEKMRRGSAMVRATLAACKLPVVSAKWDVVPGVDKSHPKHGLAKEIAQVVKENLMHGLEFRTSAGGMVTQRWSDVVRNLMLCLDFGCGVHEDVWTVDGKFLRLRNLPSRLAITFYRWHTEDDGETLLALEQYGYRRDQFVNATLPDEKMCRVTYQQEGANFWGIALQRAMYPHYYCVDRLQRIDVIAAERNSMGVPAFKLPIGFAKEDRDAAIMTVTQLSASEATGVVEPPGDASTGLRLVGVTGTLREIHPSITLHNTLIAMAALAQFLQSGSTPHGNRSVVGEHTNFFMLSEQALADQIAEAVTATTVRRFVEYNYGLDYPVPHVVAANVESRRLEDVADALTKFAQVGLVVSEGNIRTHIREELALPDETAEGIVAPRGMTITPIGEEATGGVEQQTKGGSAPQQGQNIVVGKGAIPPGYESPISKRLQPAPTKDVKEPAADAQSQLSYVALPDNEEIRELVPDKVFFSRFPLFGGLDVAIEKGGPFLVVKTNSMGENGFYKVKRRDGDRIEVERLAEAENVR